MTEIPSEECEYSNLLLTRPIHSKLFFTLTLSSLSFTVYSLFRIFRSTQLAQPLQSVRWQRLRMIGQAGIIAGLTGPLVYEGLGFDTWKIRKVVENKLDKSLDSDSNSNSNLKLMNFLLNYSLGLFARNTETIYK